MSLPTDLTREIADRAQQPGFDEVLARADRNRRRRRTTIASGLAAACVVGGLAFAVGDPLGSDNTSPEPARPGPSETYDGTPEVDQRLSARVRKLLGGEFADLRTISGSDGAVAALWHACPGDGDCRLVLVTEGPLPTAEMVTSTMLEAVPGGWLVLHGGNWTRITPTGGIQAVLEPGGPGSSDVRAGDTAVLTTTGLRLLRGNKLVPMPGVGPGGWNPSSAYVTPEGRLVMTPTIEGPTRVIVSDDGGRVWRMTHTVGEGSGTPATGLLAGHGDSVAYVALRYDADGSIPVLEIAVSSDAGESWRVARGDFGAEGMSNPTSLAVSPAGTTYVTTGSHGVVRIDADGNATTTRLSSHDHSAFVLGEDICVVAEAGRVDELQCSEDDGATWTPRALPGFQ